MLKSLFASGLAVMALLAGPGPASAGGDCSGKARAAWRQAGEGYWVEAAATGPACGKAVVRLAIVAAGGKALHRYEGTADQNLAFQDATTKASMAKALAEWVNPQASLKTSGKLPDWKAGEESPIVAAEFPFHVEAGISRADYLAIRKADRPMFCYVQGMESQACVVLQPSGAVQKVGAQSFPG